MEGPFRKPGTSGPWLLFPAFSFFFLLGFFFWFCLPVPASDGPVILLGKDLPAHQGIPSKQLSLFALAEYGLRRIPLQVDHRICDGQGPEEQTCSYVMDDGEAPLHPDDEVLFLKDAAGFCDLALAERRAVADGILDPGTRLQEIRVESQTDPHRGHTCVYLGRTRPGFPSPELPGRIWCDPSGLAVEGETYRVSFDPENPYFWKEVSIRSGDSWKPVLGEEQFSSTISNAGGLVLYRLDKRDTRSELAGCKAGPVRAMRLVRLRVRSGPWLWKETLEMGFYYRDRLEITFTTGTYLHWKFLVEEKLNLFILLTADARPCHSLPEETVVRKQAIHQATLRAGQEPKLSFFIPEGKILYRLSTVPAHEKKRTTLRIEPWVWQWQKGPRAAGFCVPNLQDGYGPRQPFRKELVFSSIEAPCEGPSAYGGEGPTASPLCSAEQEIAGDLPCPDPFGEPKQKRSWGVVPVLSSGPDRGFGLGLKFRHPELYGPEHSLESRFLYTIHQYHIAEFWYLLEGFPTCRNRVRIVCNSYNKPRARFYGIGNDTDERDGADYRWGDLEIGFTLGQELVHNLSLYAGWEARMGEIGKGKIAGWPQVGERYPGLFGLDGGWASGPFVALEHSTLDSRRDPTKGGRRSLSATFFEDRAGGRYSFQRCRLEAVQVFPLPQWDHRIVLRGQMQVERGRVPFYLLSWVGGPDTVRGYYEGRFRDRDRLVANAEYRSNLFKFLDGVLFLDAGRTRHDFLKRPTLRDLHVTGGLGLRFRLYPDLLARLDVGISSEKVALYFDFGHPF